MSCYGLRSPAFVPQRRVRSSCSFLFWTVCICLDYSGLNRLIRLVIYVTGKIVTPTTGCKLWFSHAKAKTPLFVLPKLNMLHKVCWWILPALVQFCPIFSLVHVKSSSECPLRPDVRVSVNSNVVLYSFMALRCCLYNSLGSLCLLSSYIFMVFPPPGWLCFSINVVLLYICPF